MKYGRTRGRSGGKKVEGRGRKTGLMTGNVSVT